MPELPEVETTIFQLRKKVLNRTFIDIWTNAENLIKKPKNYQEFKKEIKNKKIKNIWRRGKNILFDLSSNKTLLIHQKLTGHLLFGKWKKEKNQWISEIKGPLSEDPINRFLHFIFFLDNGWQLALSDLRKFAKLELLDEEELKKELSLLGPEPLTKNFSLEKFSQILKKRKGKIKQTLMDQSVIAGLGNIYSDEILWQAKIHPFRKIEKLTKEEIKRIYQAIRKILPRAIELKGESISDYRTLTGKKGNFDKIRKVYRKEGEKCSRCKTTIKKIKISGRSAHFCPQCQI